MKNATRYTLHAKRRFGFTLIELLVVIGIMGTLITVLLPNFIGGRQRSKDARRRLDIEQISSALEQYRSVAGVYPTSVTLDCDSDRETLSYTDTAPDPDVTTTFLTAIPQDPGCSSYIYMMPVSTTTDYTVCAYLEATTSTTGAGTVDCGDNNCNYCKGPYGTK